MIDPIVRPAVETDGPQLRWLELESREQLQQQRGGARWLATHDERGASWEAAADAGDVVVAVIDDVVVGYIVMGRHSNVATIDDVYVTPQARELGFGDAMLGVVIERARDEGARFVEGEALPGDRDTKNLYERAAIKARLITVSTEL